jgi:protein-L-isoaspartate O-methyltransferase
VTGYVPLNERPLGGHARLLSMTLADGPRDVLDVGCSSGYLATPLAEAGVRGAGRERDPGAPVEGRRAC